VRGRLLAAFVLVAIPPLLVFGVAVWLLVSREFERSAARRLEKGVQAAQARLSELRRRAESQVALVVDNDLPDAGPDPDLPNLGRRLATARDLSVLEVIDGQGRILTSHHWPAGLGLPDRDLTFPAGTYRYEQTALGHGVGRSLALTVERRGSWSGVPVTVRGGFLLDGAFLHELSLMDAEVVLLDVERARWTTPPDSPLVEWPEPLPRARGGGEVLLPTGAFRWSAVPLAPGLLLLMAVPASSAEVTEGLRRVTAAVGLLALAAALAAALVLSRRIAAPVQSLAAGARRVAGGDLTGSVQAAGPGEVADLARAFNSMTAELRASRERLLQAERVAAWREMARRLAHELKNPLFPIQLSIETLRRAARRPPAGGPAFPELFDESSQTILEELHSLRKIIDEFSEFARMPQPRLAPTDPGEVVDRVLSLYEARFGQVQVRRELAPGLPSLPADADLLGRALGNLVANALEAMPDGGTLTVRTEAVDGAVRIEVRDTGPGLSDEQRTGRFTPYYTTKKAGTGLGLAIVQGVVSDHGGRIEVWSEPGVGTAFTLVLPGGGGPRAAP
jgi:two-component system, NtrC family, nitrogen regulation sensor histidine kinase NtrY